MSAEDDTKLFEPLNSSQRLETASKPKLVDRPWVSNTSSNLEQNEPESGNANVGITQTNAVTTSDLTVSVSALLHKNRQSLLDLTLRNRLLNVPKQSKTSRTIQIVDEISSEVFRLIVTEGKVLTFKAGKEKKKDDLSATGKSEEEDDEIGELPQPGDDEADERGVARRHSDRILQTLLTSEGLQKRLLTMYYDAKTLEEEQGVNILYLSLGMLKWFEDKNSEIERFAPLILIPVELERSNAADRFKLKWREEDVSSNISLQAKIKNDFGIALPDLPESDSLDIDAYFAEVQKCLKSQSRFEVLNNDIALGFFSFSKFLMYRDLDPENWPEASALDKNSLIVSLLKDGFKNESAFIGDDDHIDEHIKPINTFHVMDADSSQSIAIEEVRRGKNLVIQGPPGTGKSQTIANIIAAAVAEGKKVLFVAEKMAALDVVHRRLTREGLDSICLELHSHKTNKRMVLEELKKTKELGRPKGHDQGKAANAVTKLREALNTHAKVLHEKHEPSGFTPYQIIGKLLELKDNNTSATGMILTNPEQWSYDDYQDRVKLLEDIEARIQEMGSPDIHPWRGVCRQPLLPSEYERLMAKIKDVAQLLVEALPHLEFIERNFKLNTTGTLKSLTQVLEVAKAFASMPDCEQSRLSDPIWKESEKSITANIASGFRYSELKDKLTSQVKESAWGTDFKECRQTFAVHGDSVLRFVSPSFRRAKNLLKSVLNISLPKKSSECLAIIDDVMEVQSLSLAIKDSSENMEKAFGRLWQGVASDWKALSLISDWRSTLHNMSTLPVNFLDQASVAPRDENYGKVVEQLGKIEPAFWQVVKELFLSLELDTKTAFHSNSIDTLRIQDVLSRIKDWIENGESLTKWISFKRCLVEAQDKGMGCIVDALMEGKLSESKILPVFQKAYFDTLVEIVFSKYPSLRAFDGDAHSKTVEQFRDFDLQRINQARIEIANIHFNNIPRGDGGSGALGALNGELHKKRGHMPIRKLLRLAGPVIQSLKPVFMMSPLSIAQFLEPGGLTFDLLLIDEASQIEPVDALGAIARCKQIVVVGDSKQLPPTRFFSRITGNDNDDDDDDGTLAASNVESILGLCLAKGLPEKMLRWHYRSKHQSLIAVSNKEFYDNRLFIVPSPFDEASGMGLKFHYFPESTFDSGGTATNAIEAKKVALAVMKHAKERPDQSLGVVAFSIKQKQAILDEVELLRRNNPDAESFFTQMHPNEPFFVKNLENVQGDERDAIFISVGYGKNKQGYMAMRFGPLSAEGGERRLNVLISRAKRRCEVFSSITADDIDTERAKGRGVTALKLFLKFAQTGKLDFGKITENEADSLFEEQVAAALRARGYDIKLQVGIAGFFVDIGVSDPNKPGRFVLGIECDGASYHSSRSARDRDRLRQAVLEDHGWIIHRIWSTDWFQRPQEQLNKTVAAIEAARVILDKELEDLKNRAANTFEIVTLEREDVSEMHVNFTEKKLSVPYQEAHFPVPHNTEPHEVSDQLMSDYVAKIVEAEGPIHESEIINRIKAIWNKDRAGSRIQDKVLTGIKMAKSSKRIAGEKDFYVVPGAVIPIRDRSEAPLSVRKPESLPPAEIRQAIFALIQANFGADQDMLPNEIGKLFGFKSTSPQLRYVVESQVKSLLKKGEIANVEGLLKVSENAKQATG